MSYICPFCRNTLIYDSQCYYCYETSCGVNYSIHDSFKEEYETDAYGLHFHIELYKNDYSISIKNEDVTDIIGNFFTIDELKLQGKTISQIIDLINKIQKINDMKVFW